MIQRVEIKFSVIFIIVLGIFMIGALVCSKPSDDLQVTKCFTNIVIKSPAIITLNCDSSEFINLTQSPHRIFNEKSIRQSRPGLSFLAYICTPIFRPLEGLIDTLKPEAKRNEHGRADLHPKEDLVAYSALIFLNMLMIFVGYLFYQNSLIPPRRSTPQSYTMPAFLISLMLIMNEMVKLFILSPHTQLLNITVPIFSFWVGWRAYSASSQAWCLGTRSSYILAGILGLTLLIYASFIVPFVVFISVCFLRHWQEYRFSRWGIFIAHSCGITALFTLPSFLWYCTVMQITGSYYVHEIHQYNYVSWIWARFQEGGTLSVLGGYGQSILTMLQNSAPDFIPTILIATIVTIWGYPVLRQNADLRQSLKQRLLLALWIDFLFLGLFSSMGYYPARLSYSIIPVWWPIIGYLANEAYLSKHTSVSPKILVWGLTIGLGMYAIWLLWSPWDFRLW